MKQTLSAYLVVSQAAFSAACLFGLSYALSYLRFVQENNWLAWMPGVGIALLLAAAVMCYVGQMQSVRNPGNHARYLRWCIAAFIVACLSANLALTYVHLAHQNTWAAWKPGVGVLLIFLSVLLSYIGFVLSERRGSQSLSRSVRPGGASLA